MTTVVGGEDSVVIVPLRLRMGVFGLFLLLSRGMKIED